MIKVTLRERNYTGTACGLDFVASVAMTDLPRDHFLLRRMEALFPGVQFEDMSRVKESIKADAGSTTLQDAANRAAADKVAEAEAARQAKIRATMTASAAKEVADDKDKDEDEDGDGDEDTSSNTTDLKPPLGPGSSVIVDYKGVLRTGEVVKVVGDKLHVKLDDDDAAYRVINTDKVVE